MKRAQRFRLEDQRGTEINFELPDFLKDNENARNKFRKTKAGSTATEDTIEQKHSLETTSKLIPPQPAPRLSVTKGQNALQNTGNDSMNHDNRMNSSCSSTMSTSMNGNSNGNSQSYYENCDKTTNNNGFGTPPPLPPKPKIKSNNWTSVNVNVATTSIASTSSSQANGDLPSISELSPRRKIQLNDNNMTRSVNSPVQRSVYLDQPNSSFV